VHDTTKHITSPFSNTLPRQAHMQRSPWESPFVTSLTRKPDDHRSQRMTDRCTIAPRLLLPGAYLGADRASSLTTAP